MAGGVEILRHHAVTRLETWLDLSFGQGFLRHLGPGLAHHVTVEATTNSLT
jgi:hypothetical protein